MTSRESELLPLFSDLGLGRLVDVLVGQISVFVSGACQLQPSTFSNSARSSAVGRQSAA